MTATATPTTVVPRRPLAPWILAITAAVVLIGVLEVSGARLTWDVPTTTVQTQEQTPTVSIAMVEQANGLAAARGELTALRTVVRDNPSISAALRDEMQLLAAVGAGHVPVEALERRDDMQLRKAVRAGQVPTQALNSLE